MPFSNAPLIRRLSSGPAALLFELVIAAMLAAGSLPGGSSTALAQGGAPSAGPPPAAPAATPAAPTAGSTANAPTVATQAEIAGHDFIKDRDAIFDKFYATGLDTATAYAVSNLTIRKDTVTLLLKQGTVFLMQPIEGEVTGAAFVGDGLASMTPPNRWQRYMLNKHSGAETLQEAFTEAVFRFCDSTEKTILVAGKPDPSGAARAQHASEIFKDRNEWLNGTRWLQGRRGLHLEMQFLENRISGLHGQDFFLVDFHSAKHDWLTYLYDPQDIHENFLASTETTGAKGRRYLVPWCVWHKQSDYGQGEHYVLPPDRDGPRVITIRHNDMVLDLHTTKTVEWTSKAQIEPLTDNLHCLRFDLVNNAKRDTTWEDKAFWPSRVVSVTDEAGSPLPFMHKKDQLLVILPTPAHAGAIFSLQTKGQADVIYEVTAESFGLLESPWYPQYGYLGGRSTFHWTIRVPRPLLATGSGKILRRFEDREANQNVVETETDLPVSFPWMIFGKFRIADGVYTSEETKKNIGLTINTVTINGSANPAKKIEGFMGETKDILKLYETIYGPFPYEELHIAQMGPNLGFGQGPPYFVQLTGDVFLEMSSLGVYSVHGFLSHEIAHQWWGNQIGWASDDDVWLSEGFAEYAAGIFAAALQKEEGFHRMLDQWRMDAKKGDKEAPIAAAEMLSGPNAGDFKDDLLYKKAPYVLHMLRVQLDDEKYKEVMRAIQQGNKEVNLSTEMFLSQLNRITGSDFTYFFDQWIWDVGIPIFHYTWHSERQPDGKFMIMVHVSQSDKNHLKKVLMPIHIHFKDKTIPQYKPVLQAEQDIKILSPIEPKDVTLDDNRTLLADIVKGS